MLFFLLSLSRACQWMQPLANYYNLVEVFSVVARPCGNLFKFYIYSSQV